MNSHPSYNPLSQASSRESAAIVVHKTNMFGGRLASFGEIAVAAGYPCCMSYLAISMTTTTTTTPQATSVFTAATTHHVV
jgi:hypothetical protein